VTHYRRGRTFEHKVKTALEADGYWTQLAPGSKGVDAVAIKSGQILLVSVKRTNGTIPPAERAELLRVAALTGGVPVIAHQPIPRRPIQYRRLTGPGPKDWQPWTPDEVAP
jgi:Holliday junction resolvase